MMSNSGQTAQPWSCKLVKMTNTELLPWSASKEEVVTGPYHYLKRLPGKDFRPVLIKAFNSVLKVDHKALSIISNVVEMLHTASLLLDDVEDNAELRRGFPVAHSLFGTAQVINSANYMFFLALEELTKLNSPLVYQIYTDELKNLHRGQGMDLYWRETLVCPTEDDYLDMVINKTGGLYRLACRLMQAVSPDPSVDLIPLANVFGVLYQIHDDYLNLQSDAYAKNKGFCEDLTEGKFSFPVIHSIRANPNNKELLNILKQHTTDVSLKQYAVSYMRDQTKSFDYTLKTVAEYETLARQLIQDLSSKQDVSQLEAILSRMLAVK